MTSMKGEKMKKILIVLLLMFVAIGSSFALGIGGMYSVNVITDGLPQNAMLTIHAPEAFPAVIGVGFAVGENTFNLGLTADWWAYQSPIAGALGLYAGPGMYAIISEDPSMGGRIAVGINMYPLDFLELFLELAPQVGVGFGNNTITFPVWGVQGGFGFRFWF